jgi:hypothetical protein
MIFLYVIDVINNLNKYFQIKIKKIIDFLRFFELLLGIQI